MNIWMNKSLKPKSFDKTEEALKSPANMGLDRPGHKAFDIFKKNLGPAICQKGIKISNELSKSAVYDEQPHREDSRTDSEIISNPIPSPIEEKPTNTQKNHLTKFLNLDIVFRNNQYALASNQMSEKNSESFSSQKSYETSKDLLNTSQSSRIKSERIEEIQKKLKNEKYGDYEKLSKLYEAESFKRQHFESMYSKLYDENQELKNLIKNKNFNSNEESEKIIESLQREVQELVKIVQVLRMEKCESENNTFCEKLAEELRNENENLKNTIEKLNKRNSKLGEKKGKNTRSIKEEDEYLASVENQVKLLKQENESLKFNEQLVKVLKEDIKALESNDKVVKLLKAENESLKESDQLMSSLKTQLEGLEKVVKSLKAENEALKGAEKMVKSLRLEIEELKKTEKLVKDLQIENQSLKSRQKSLNDQKHENISSLSSTESLKKTQIPDTEPESLSNILKNSIKGIKNPKESGDKISLIENENQALKLQLQELNEKYSKLLADTEKEKELKSDKRIKKLFSSDGFLKDSIKLLKGKGLEKIMLKAESLFDGNEELSSIFSSLHEKMEQKHKESIKALQSEIEQVKFNSETEKQQLMHEIKGLRRGNKEIFNRLRQKTREFDHYECHTLLKRSATKLSGEALDNMDKQELLNQFNYLKKEYNELSKKILSQADEMFEKKTEIKLLNKWKTSLCKEIEILKEQNKELNELKEHVAYLLFTIQQMKEKIKQLGEMYEGAMKKKEKEKGNAEYAIGMKIISDIIKVNTNTVSQKDLSNMNWKDEEGKNKLMGYLKNSILGFVLK